MSGTAGITCRMHSRSTVQCINLETCVIGKTGYAISSAYPLSLGKGITLKRRSILGYVVMTSYVGEADNFKFVHQRLKGGQVAPLNPGSGRSRFPPARPPVSCG